MVQPLTGSQRPWAFPLLSLLLVWAGGADAVWPSLQPQVDAAEPGAVLTLEPGTYAGPLLINKSLTLDGRGQVTIDAGGQGSVITLAADGATLKGLRLTGSGNSHNDTDAGVLVRGRFNVIKDNRIDDCLFGIDLQQSEHNQVRRNQISSKAVDLGVRGDAIRLWYSFNNEVTDNLVRDSRDMVVWYSRDNLIARNDARRGRYSLHFMYSQYNRIEDNYFEDNAVGIFFMYSDGLVMRNNTIARATGPTGIGIGFNESSDVTVENNRILYNAEAIYLDISPFQPDTTNRISGNLIAYNGVGIRFLNDWKGNEFKGNSFKGNLTQVVVSGGRTAARNLWEDNHWEDYEGFDLDQDGIGDRPHEMYAYADRIWMDIPPARFFKGSPLLEVVDFLERLAPFSPPNLMLRDARPHMASQPVPQLTAAPIVQDEEADAKAPGQAPPVPDSYDLLKQSLGRP